MFDIGAAELLVIIVVAVIVIGPKDMPLAMRTAGRWIGKVRRVSAHFRTGIDAMVREAELEDMEAKWKARNEEIMKRSSLASEADAGAPVMTGPPPVASKDDALPAPQTTAPETPTSQSQTRTPSEPEASEDRVPPADVADEPVRKKAGE
ncbi:MAG: Sec-independent protein translocase protein TatB [Erythrobacter sp.]